MKRYVSIMISLIGLASVIAFASCGGGSSVDNPPPNPPVISMNPLPPAGTASVAYPGFTFTVASGGQAPFTWSETGALPPGLTLSSGGLLSGTPTSAGSFPLTVIVKDAASPPQTGSQAFTIVINNPPPPVINTTPPPSSTVGATYPGFTFTATGGLPPLTWSETGALPPGLTLSSDGLLSGTLTSAGSFPITVIVKDAASPPQTGSQAFTIIINPPLTVINTIPPPPLGTVSATYPGFTFTAATGGTPPLTWSEAGALPPGLAFSSGGLLSGTPTSAGSFAITVTVKDASSPQQTASQGFTIGINPALSAINTTPPPPSGTVGTPYPGFTFTAAGGTSPLTWSEAGALPPGLTLTSDGLLSGTPTSAGTFPITVTVKDASAPQQTASQGFTILINNPPPPAINTTPPPLSGAVGTTYPGFTFTATGGLSPLTWSETGALPPGLTFSSGGLLSGTPTAVGSFPVTLHVQDSLGQNSAPQAFTLSVFLHGFKATGSMGTGRVYHTATLLNDGKVLVTGGQQRSNVLNNQGSRTAELFDPISGVFTPTGSMSYQRAGHTATLLNNGKVLVTGGYHVIRIAGPCILPPGRSCYETITLATAELFDPTNGTFTLTTGSMSAGRFGHTATLLNNGKVLVTGGISPSNGSVVLATAELFDPISETFTPTTGSMSAGRYGHTATLLNNGKVLVAGGFGNSSPGATAELFDPTSETFTPTTGSMAIARGNHTATSLNDGKVLLTGGTGSTTAEVFDPTSETFTLTGSMATLRVYTTATLLTDGTVLVAGGTDANNLILATAELFDPVRGTFTGTGSMQAPRTSHTATLLNDGTVLVTGGSAYLATAELYH